MNTASEGTAGTMLKVTNPDRVGITATTHAAANPDRPTVRWLEDTDPREAQWLDAARTVR